MDTTTPRSRGQRTTRLGLAALAVVTAVGVPAALAGLPAGGATVPPEPVPATATTATTATTYPGGGAEP